MRERERKGKEGEGGKRKKREGGTEVRRKVGKDEKEGGRGRETEKD